MNLAHTQKKKRVVIKLYVEEAVKMEQVEGGAAYFMRGFKVERGG